MARVGPSISYGDYGGHRPVSGKKPPGRPYIYDSVYFRTREERDKFARVRSLYNQVKRHGLPWTEEGISQYRRIRAEITDDIQFNVLETKAKREVSMALRLRHGLGISGPLPKRFLAEYESDLKAYYRNLRK